LEKPNNTIDVCNTLAHHKKPSYLDHAMNTAVSPPYRFAVLSAKGPPGLVLDPLAPRIKKQ
jgi:hypothetical protein